MLSKFAAEIDSVPPGLSATRPLWQGEFKGVSAVVGNETEILLVVAAGLVVDCG
jgi:hypothetical protein